jgi:hypothetical protein
MIIEQQPFHVIQVFSNSYEYDKLYKDFNDRKELVQWKNDIQSNTNVAEKLILNETAFQKKTGNLGDLVVLIDRNFSSFEDFLLLQKLNNTVEQDIETSKSQYLNELRQRNDVIFGQLVKNAASFEIFKLKKESEIELWLNWDYWTVGEPERSNFKIAELKLNQPILIKLDGKRDFSLTGRRKRTFMEHQYVIEYKGLFNNIEVTNSTQNYNKTLPTNVKAINLMKHIK